MKKIIGLVIFTIVFVCLVTVPVFSADVAKIGLVDFQKIVATSSAGKLIQKKLQAKGNEFSQKLQNMQKEIVELEKKLKTESMVLNQENVMKKGVNIELR